MAVKEFLKSFWILCVVLLGLVIGTVYTLARLYSASCLLVEAEKKSLVQRVDSRAAIVSDLLSSKLRTMEELARSPFVRSYYQNKALGMSLEYGLAVSRAAVADEFDRHQRIAPERYPYGLVGIALFDLEEDSVTIESHHFRMKRWAPSSLFTTIKQRYPLEWSLIASNHGDRYRLFLVRRFDYKDQPKGYLVAELDLEKMQSKIELPLQETDDHFTAFVDFKGSLISGPKEMIGKEIGPILAASPELTEGVRIVEGNHFSQAGSANSWMVVQRYLLDTGLSLIRVEPAAQFLTGRSWILWAGLLGLWASVFAAMLFLIFRGFRERHRMYMELQHAHNSLESRVQERTAQLVRTNANLRKEMMERAKAEKDCMESEARFKELAELLPQIIFETDATGKFTFLNRFGLAVGCVSEEDLAKGFVVSEAVSAEDRSRVLANFRRILRGETVSGEQYEALRKNGDQFPIVTYAAPIIKDNRIVGMRGVAVDITELKRVQQELYQAQKMEAIGTLAGGVAHDFNNILTVIQGFTELLLMRKSKDDIDYGDLDTVLQAARRGADLVKQLTAFSRKAEPDLRPVDLNLEAQGTVKMLLRTFPKSINIHTFLDGDVDKVNADPGQIQQVLLNLAINAKDAMPDGGTVVISTESVQLDDQRCETQVGCKAKTYALLRVSDTGHGMEKAVRDRIFEPFYTTKVRGRGTGLGLAVVLGIVQSHGGFITCQSKVGEGTIFEVYFPAMNGDEISNTKPAETMAVLGTETVLLVDDEEYVRDVGERILKESGYRVLTAENGRRALTLYREQQQDIGLVILDFIMPEMDGGECLEQILKLDPQAKVIISSGYSIDTNGQQFQMAAKGFVDKPYDCTKLLQTVRDVLDAA
ncbi:MAG: ATP-binding protein [Thermodesulfobacteriota bacterium]